MLLDVQDICQNSGYLRLHAKLFVVTSSMFDEHSDTSPSDQPRGTAYLNKAGQNYDFSFLRYHRFQQHMSGTCPHVFKRQSTLPKGYGSIGLKIIFPALKTKPCWYKRSIMLQQVSQLRQYVKKSASWPVLSERILNVACRRRACWRTLASRNLNIRDRERTMRNVCKCANKCTR